MTAQKTCGPFRDPPRAGSRIYRAPGRVNLIGEHTDYNDGFVMPAAIDLSTWIAISPRSDRTISLVSENFPDEFSFDLDDAVQPEGHWSDYVRGVATTLEQAGYRLRGAHLQIRGEVPIGSGLSSSAALEVAAGIALLDHAGFRVDLVELAKLCQRAENDFVGTRCGIMDQFIACHGQKGKALMLDCRSLDFERLPLPEDVQLVICNTMVKHRLANGEYNRRRAECEEGAHRLAARLPNVRTLRDVTMAELESNADELPELIYRRCRHVISENARVLKAAAALERDDSVEFGELMNDSHRSLRDDYEVSCVELDTMANLAREVSGVYGARMIGGGFGGCTINLVSEGAVEEIKESVSRNYQRATGITPEIYVCRAESGVREVTFGS